MREWRYDIDWLRLIVTLVVFLFHCTHFLEPQEWHLKNPEQSRAIFSSC